MKVNTFKTLTLRRSFLVAMNSRMSDSKSDSFMIQSKNLQRDFHGCSEALDVAHDLSQSLLI